MAKTRFTESTTPTEAVAGQHVLRIRAAAYPRGDAQDDLLMDELKVRRIPAGFVMLFTSDFLPIEPANEFLLAKCALGKGSRWLNTQESYADDLAQFWSFLLVNNIPWYNATAADLDAYAEVLGSAISPTTSRKYSKQTVSRRVGTAERFRDWLSTRGYAPRLDKVERVTTIHVADERLLLPHLGPVVSESRERRPRKNSKSAHVAFISNNDLIRIFSHLGPSPYANHENDLRPIRDRVVADVFIFGNARRRNN